MKEELNSINSLIDELNIDEKNKRELLNKFTDLQKKLTRTEFKLDRTLRDKTISSNVLNTTIKELEIQKQLVEENSMQLQASLKKLEVSFNELEQFAYIASHDLKSPLRTISNFGQLLQRNYGDKMGDEADQFINFIVTGAQHMNEVISDLLEYSRVGNKNKDFTIVKMIDIIDLVKFNLAESINETNADIIIDNPNLELKANRSSMLQLFQNLIGNGIKFCEGKTPVVKITCKALENAWEFSVTDNGVGMEESYQDKVFLPFQRLNSIERPGTGIGLAICKKSVKIHGGEIRYESKVGEGTTFIFTIPQAEMPVLEESVFDSNVIVPQTK